RPGAAGAVLGLPAAELTDGAFELDDLWGARGRTLRARLEEAPTPEARIAVLERAVLGRLGAADDGRLSIQIARAVARAPRLARVARVAELERIAGWTQRQLRRRFERDIGLAPKRYLRLVRFQAIFERLRLTPAPSWRALAQDLGYCDQAHLIT